MKVELMRKIDRQVGRLLTYPLSLFSRSGSILPKKDIRTIVVSKYFGIGSITLSTPLLQSLRDRFPDAKILFLTFCQNAELLVLFPFIDQVIIIRDESLLRFIVDTVKTILRLRFHSRVDLFIDMEFFSHYSSIMAWLSGSKFRVGFHTSLLPRGRLLTHRVAFNPHRYITEAFNALGQKIGAMKEFPLYEPRISDVYVRRVSEWLNDRGLENQKYIVINTRSSDHLGELKQWPVGKWSGLAAEILKSLGLPMILTGIKKDRDDLEQIIKPLPDYMRGHIHNSAGEFSLGEFLALLQRSKFLITIDSGPLHLSQSLGVSCVALFGPETPVVYGPRRRYDRTVSLDLYCSPCCNILEGKKAVCTNPFYNQCMRGIEVETVLREVIVLNSELETDGNNC